MSTSVEYEQGRAAGLAGESECYYELGSYGAAEWQAGYQAGYEQWLSISKDVAAKPCAARRLLAALSDFTSKLT